VPWVRYPGFSLPSHSFAFLAFALAHSTVYLDQYNSHILLEHSISIVFSRNSLVILFYLIAADNLIISSTGIPHLATLISKCATKFQQELVSTFLVDGDVVNEGNDHICTPFGSRKEKVPKSFGWGGGQFG